MIRVPLPCLLRQIGKVRSWLLCGDFLRDLLKRKPAVLGPSLPFVPSSPFLALQPSESISPDARPPLPQAAQPTPPAPQPPPDPLDNGPWLKLVENCVDLFDELDSHLDHFDPSGRELAEHTGLRLQEILQRCGVELIDQPGDFERSLHQPVDPSAHLGSATVTIISPGFRVGRRVLRRARVSLAPGAPAAPPGSTA